MREMDYPHTEGKVEYCLKVWHIWLTEWYNYTEPGSQVGYWYTWNGPEIYLHTI